jgi:hypothetical protein
MLMNMFNEKNCEVNRAAPLVRSLYGIDVSGNHDLARYLLSRTLIE